MNLQFEAAFQILVAIYGMPAWDVKPKEGQNRDEIIRLWCEELKSYTTDQIKTACYWLVRKRRSMTFPTIHHLKAELVCYDNENNKSNERERVIQLAQEAGRRFGKEAYRHMLNEFCITDAPAFNDFEKKELKDMDDDLKKRNLLMFEFLKSQGYSGLIALIEQGRDTYNRVMNDFEEFYKTEVRKAV